MFNESKKPDSKTGWVPPSLEEWVTGLGTFQRDALDMLEKRMRPAFFEADLAALELRTLNHMLRATNTKTTKEAPMEGKLQARKDKMLAKMRKLNSLKATLKGDKHDQMTMMVDKDTPVDVPTEMVAASMDLAIDRLGTEVKALNRVPVLVANLLRQVVMYNGPDAAMAVKHLVNRYKYNQKMAEETVAAAKLYMEEYEGEL